ncbi:hypothetical protein FNF29_00699 [Cafeteria roenbergensis]|uniref:Uncharacterized protein n=1 Tax=Cafeteria roenbergensis TaxID=33653 RepID=A0A5A8CV09_CAFRO|nr:hypothetical protein FNF29_00699 [Cafeteria roenbergensis]|eukprot:KAA0156588.1 hypothetical protein FNF29_00699 [Cafeteria roenbergensis]
MSVARADAEAAVTAAAGAASLEEQGGEAEAMTAAAGAASLEHEGEEEEEEEAAAVTAAAGTGSLEHEGEEEEEAAAVTAAAGTGSLEHEGEEKEAAAVTAAAGAASLEHEGEEEEEEAAAVTAAAGTGSLEHEGEEEEEEAAAVTAAAGTGSLEHEGEEEEAAAVTAAAGAASLEHEEEEEAAAVTAAAGTGSLEHEGEEKEAAAVTAAAGAASLEHEGEEEEEEAAAVTAAAGTGSLEHEGEEEEEEAAAVTAAAGTGSLEHEGEEEEAAAVTAAAGAASLEHEEEEEAAAGLRTTLPGTRIVLVLVGGGECGSHEGSTGLYGGQGAKEAVEVAHAVHAAQMQLEEQDDRAGEGTSHAAAAAITSGSELSPALALDGTMGSVDYVAEPASATKAVLDALDKQGGQAWGGGVWDGVSVEAAQQGGGSGEHWDDATAEFSGGDFWGEAQEPHGGGGGSYAASDDAFGEWLAGEGAASQGHPAEGPDSLDPAACAEGAVLGDDCGAHHDSPVDAEEAVAGAGDSQTEGANAERGSAELAAAAGAPPAVTFLPAMPAASTPLVWDSVGAAGAEDAQSARRGSGQAEAEALRLPAAPPASDVFADLPPVPEAAWQPCVLARASDLASQGPERAEWAVTVPAALVDGGRWNRAPGALGRPCEAHAEALEGEPAWTAGLDVCWCLGPGGWRDGVVASQAFRFESCPSLSEVAAVVHARRPAPGGLALPFAPQRGDVLSISPADTGRAVAACIRGGIAAQECPPEISHVSDVPAPVVAGEYDGTGAVPCFLLVLALASVPRALG